MKVFLSWSGDLSRRVATVLRDWLPSVLQAVSPYVSSEDIDKGVRWSSDLTTELEESKFGILCVTAENFDSPWICFEAGALSRTVEKTHVCPFLFGIKRSRLKGPLIQFQSTVYEKEDIKKLVRSLNVCLDNRGLEDVRLSSVYEVWWPSLKENLDVLMREQEKSTAVSTNGKTEETESSMTQKMLEEILDLSRNQVKLLRSPDVIIPPEHLLRIFGKMSQKTMEVSYWRELLDVNNPVWHDIVSALRAAKMLIEKEKKRDSVPYNDLEYLLNRFIQPLEYLLDKVKVSEKLF